jgi:hypothetical protein
VTIQKKKKKDPAFAGHADKQESRKEDKTDE